MPTVTQLRAAIAQNLIDVLGTDDQQILTFSKKSPSPPSLEVVGLGETTATAFQGGGYTLPFIVRAYLRPGDERGTSEQLDAYLDPSSATSVWAALESDRSLGGLISDGGACVTRHDGHQVFELDDGTRLPGSTWHLQVEV